MAHIRIQKLREQLVSQKIDAYLSVRDEDIRYLTGFPAHESWLLVGPQKTVFFTDPRYSQEARQHLKGVAVRECCGPLREEVARYVTRRSLKTIGFDERHFSVFSLKQLKNALPEGTRLKAVNDAVLRLRLIKDQEEISRIKESLALNIKAYQYLKTRIHPGMRERDVFAKLLEFVSKNRIGFAFDPIIASGPNSAFPHARITDRRIERKDLLLIDMGMEKNGYKSDLTRIFLFARISPSVEKVYKAVAEAQQTALGMIRDGIAVSQVDQAARKSLKKQGLDKHFIHSLGHGLGLEIHEPPRLSMKSSEVLKAGMVVTVEPGVYLKGRFGIRIEDMVLVKDQGCEVLSQSLISSHPFLLK